MQTYRVTQAVSCGDYIEIDADSYEAAAVKGARKVHPDMGILRTRRCGAIRQTGEPTLSGMFGIFCRLGKQDDHATRVTTVHVVAIDADGNAVIPA